VPKWERPSSPPEKRHEFERPISRMASRQQKAAFEDVLKWQGVKFVGPAVAVDGATHWSFSFEERRETCFDFESVGDFHIEGWGLRFSS
jgi:hypothetical protein